MPGLSVTSPPNSKGQLSESIAPESHCCDHACLPCSALVLLENMQFSSDLPFLGGRKLNTYLFFSNFSGAPGISRQAKILGYPARKFGFPGLRRTYRTSWPPPLHVKDPHPTRRYPDQKVWVWVPFSSMILSSDKNKGRRCSCLLSASSKAFIDVGGTST